MLPLLFTALTAAAFGVTLTAWRRGGVLARVHQGALLAGMVGLVWFCAQWNLLGWRFG